MSLKKIDLYKYSYFIANIIGANCLIGCHQWFLYQTAGWLPSEAGLWLAGLWPEVLFPTPADATIASGCHDNRDRDLLKAFAYSLTYVQRHSSLTPAQVPHIKHAHKEDPVTNLTNIGIEIIERRTKIIHHNKTS